MIAQDRHNSHFRPYECRNVRAEAGRLGFAHAPDEAQKAAVRAWDLNLRPAVYI